jgi:pimeloyl-ACP methyl ester carboxylesterase
MLRWAQAGSGQPAVVLEAGRNDTAITWAPVMATLAAHARVVACDRAGLGASDPAPAEDVVARQIAELAAVIGETAHGPCVLADHSWGGLLAQLLAARHPRLVAGLVLVDPAHEEMTAALPGPARWLIRAAAAPARRAIIARPLAAPIRRNQDGRGQREVGEAGLQRGVAPDRLHEQGQEEEHAEQGGAHPSMIR